MNHEIKHSDSGGVESRVAAEPDVSLCTEVEGEIVECPKCDGTGIGQYYLGDAEVETECNLCDGRGELEQQVLDEYLGAA